jgi:hypothetical protein
MNTSLLLLKRSVQPQQRLDDLLLHLRWAVHRSASRRQSTGRYRRHLSQSQR